MRRVGDVQILMAGYHAPAGAHEDFVPLQIASEVLGDAPSGRLYKALVETGLASQVGVADAAAARPRHGDLLRAWCREDASLDAARDRDDRDSSTISSTNPITAEEVERIRNQALSGFEQAMNNSQSVAIQLSNWAAIGDWRLMFLDRDRVRTRFRRGGAAHRAQVPQDARTAPSACSCPASPTAPRFRRGPTSRRCCKATKATKRAPKAKRSIRRRPTSTSRTTRVDLPGGIKLVMLPKETRGDAVNALIRLNYGDENSLRGAARLAGITTQMLMRGTRNKSRQEIQDELARLQSQLNVGGGAGLATANIQSKRENLPDVLALAIEVLREPAFPESELATLKEQTLTNIEASRSEPQAIVSRAYARHWARNYSPDDVRYVATDRRGARVHQRRHGGAAARVPRGVSSAPRTPRSSSSATSIRTQSARCSPNGSTTGAARSRSATC